MGDVVLLALVLAVAAGLVTAVVSASWVHSRQTAFSRRFLTNILLFNLLILMGLVLRYTLAQPAARPAAFRGGVLVALLAVMAVLKLGWVVVFEAMNLALVGLPGDGQGPQPQHLQEDGSAQPTGADQPLPGPEMRLEGLVLEGSLGTVGSSRKGS
jgi:hypothetical protein